MTTTTTKKIARKSNTTTANQNARQMAKANNAIKANALTDLTVLDILPDNCSPELKFATVDIATSLALGISARRMVCAKLAYVADSGILTGTTFTDKKGNADVRAYAHTVFGMQKTMAYNYASVGRQFLTPEGQLKEEYAYMGDCGASVLGLFVGMESEDVKAFFDANNAPTAANVRAWKRALKAPEKTTEKTAEKATKTAEKATDKATEKATKTTEKEEAPRHTVNKEFYVKVDGNKIQFFAMYSDSAAGRPPFAEYERMDDTSCALAISQFNALVMG